MRIVEAIEKKIIQLPALIKKVNGWRLHEKTVSFTNGCFDILHEGHIFSLSQAAKEADFLIVGMNSDESIKKLKGNNRPVNNQKSRSLILASLLMVDAVVIFNEETPYNLITSILPNVLVKGGDYTVDQIAGAKEVIANGGKVIINPIVQGFSTTSILEKIKN